MPERPDSWTDERLDRAFGALATAEPPSNLEARITARLDEARPPRRRGLTSWLAAAAVLGALLLAGTLAWVVAGPGPSPTPGPSATAQSTPEASPSPGGSPSPSASPSPSQSPTAAPSILGSWTVDIRADAPTGGLSLFVVDEAGTIADAVEATVPTGNAPDDPYALDIRQGVDTRSLIVAWLAGPCDHRAQLTLAQDGRTLHLQFAPRPACDAMGIGQAVELRFKDAVNPAAFNGRWSTDLVGPADVEPQAMAGFGDQRGFVGGRTAAAEAVILETADGGATWRVEGLGQGDVTSIGVTSGTEGAAWAGRSCPAALTDCRPGFYRYDGGSWTQVGDEWPVSLSFTASGEGAGLFLTSDPVRDETGYPIPDLRLTEDRGDTWTTSRVPCARAASHRGSVSRVDATTLVLVCESDGATGGSTKQLWRSIDRGTTWTKLADGPYSGTGAALDLLADGTGWLWADGGPLWATGDGGATWTSLVVADGNVRIVNAADALGGGSGLVLVWDPDRQARLLLATRDGVAWEERCIFPVPCCGG